MAVVADASPLDPLGDRPVYKQAADRLRALIDTGELRPGQKLPSESELMERFGVSRATVRRALNTLAVEGRVRAERGVGVFVTHGSRLTIYDPVSFIRSRGDSADEAESPLEADARAQGFDYETTAVVQETPASPRVARLLGLRPGETVLKRGRLVELRRPGATLTEPAKIANSYLPLDVAVGRIRERNTGPGGTYARLLDHGIGLTHFVEHLIVRMPDPPERRRLHLGHGVPVIDQTRVAYAGDRAVECFLAVLAGDKHELEYRMPAGEQTQIAGPAPTPQVRATLRRAVVRTAQEASEIQGTLDAGSDRPVYKQIADRIRDHIDTGLLGPGDKLPSESSLLQRFGVARTTVRRAIGHLAAEGRIRTERGVGAFVKEVVRSDAVVRQQYDRFARHHYRDEGRSPQDVDAASRGLPSTLVRQDRIELGEVVAPDAVARQLDLPTGANVFRRHRRLWFDDMPTQLTDTYIPLELAVGRLREEDMGNGGAYARIEEQGYRLTHVTERFSVRMPYPQEQRALRLERGVPVIDLYQTAFAGETPVECFQAVIAGDRYVFSYRIEA